MLAVRVTAGELMPRLEPAVDREQLPQTIGDRVRVVRETFGVANEGCEGGRGHAVMTRRAAALFLARRREAGRGLVDDPLGCGESGPDRP
jgi:hypothetical protein